MSQIHRSLLMNAEKMVSTLDQLQITERPYQKHYLADLPEYTRHQYLQMLYAIVSLNQLNDAQQRVWQLLVNSMETESATGAIDQMIIEQFTQTCREQDLIFVFLLDLFVLLRLNQVTQSQAKVIAELFALFELTADDLQTITHLSDRILNLTTDAEDLVAFNYETIRHWHEFSYQVLTVEALTSGIEGGSWIATQDFDPNVDIKIRKAQVVCLGNGFEIISRPGSNGSNTIQLRESYLTINFVLEGSHTTFIAKECSFSNEKITSKGEYSDIVLTSCSFKRIFPISDQQHIYLDVAGSIYIDNCIFELENITVIRALKDQEHSSNKSYIKHCTFTKCGNPKGYGSIAINSYVNILNSTFNQCCSEEGYGTIYVIFRDRDQTKSFISHCQFKNDNNADQWESFNKKEIAISFSSGYGWFSSSHDRDITILENCQFTNVKVDLSHFKQNRDRYKTTLKNCQFKNAPIIAHKDTYLRTDNCQFDNAGKENIITIE